MDQQTAYLLKSNVGNPQALAAIATQRGLSLEEVAQATGNTPDQMRSYLGPRASGLRPSGAPALPGAAQATLPPQAGGMSRPAAPAALSRPAMPATGSMAPQPAAHTAPTLPPTAQATLPTQAGGLPAAKPASPPVSAPTQTMPVAAAPAAPALAPQASTASAVPAGAMKPMEPMTATTGKVAAPDDEESQFVAGFKGAR